MWNAEMGRTSGRRAARLFCEAIVCGKMTAFWEAEQHEDLTLYVFYILDDIKRFFPALSTE